MDPDLNGAPERMKRSQKVQILDLSNLDFVRL
jgi:hypothetical protein